MKRLIAFLIPLLLLGGLIGWRLQLKSQEQAAQAQAAQARKNAAPNVRVAVAIRRDIVHTFEGIGSVDAPLNVKIAPKVTGRITHLTLREGDPVKVGQVIARIDPAELEAQLRQRQADLAEAQARLAEAQITTGSTDVSVSSQIRQQEAILNSAQARYNLAVENYNAQVSAAEASVADAQARIESANATIANAKAGIESARANLANAQARFNRVQRLFEKGFVAAQDVDDARTQVDVQKSAVEAAKGQMEAAVAARESAVAQKEAAQKRADITARQSNADILSARSALRQAEAALDLAKANTAQRPAYRANLEALRAAVAAAQAQVNNAQALLNETVLRAPLSGFVTARAMDPGMMATPGQTILEIQAIRQVFVTTSIPEELSRQIRAGMPAQAVFDALPGRAYVGRITQVNPAADPQSRQFFLRVTLDNPENRIRPGMFARVQIALERLPNALVVPREAVQNGPNGPTVTVVDAELTARVRPVKIGGEDTTGIAITEGLQPGEKVVTLSIQPVRDGQKVKIGETDP
jgi:RND family efflux transporter MFP subunit